MSNSNEQTEILARLSDAYKALAGAQRRVAVSRTLLKKAREVVKGIKMEYALTKYGPERVTQMKEFCAKARTTREQLRANKRNPQPTIGEVIQKIHGPIVPASQEEPRIASQVATQPPVVVHTAATCPRCHMVITKRGMCGCPGVKHRAVKVVTKAPDVQIKHPPVPAFQMGADNT